MRELLKEKILILDGAMGTSIQRRGLSEADFRGVEFAAHGVELKGNNDILNLTRPDIIADIHREYIDAGADIITANTFNSNAVSQAEYDCAGFVYRMARAGAEIAREVANAAGRKIFVAGSIGPTSKTLSLSPDVDRPEYRSVDFDTLAAAYTEQVRGLKDGGADVLLIETVFDGLNAKAAVWAAQASGLPVMISATVNDRSGRTLTGQSMEALYVALEHARPISFGLNCSFGARELGPFVERVAAVASCAVSVYPNAGLPNEMGEYDEQPADTAEQVLHMARKGLINIAGGCCGTTPAHIRAIAEALRGVAPRVIPEADKRLIVSGLDAVIVDPSRNFTNIGERTNVAGSAAFKKLIEVGSYDDAAAVARRQIDDGAAIIDVNMDDAMLDSVCEMTTFTRFIANDPDIARAALMIDSSDWETLLSGLKNAQGKSIVNSISLKEGEDEFLRRAGEIRRLGAAVVVMAFDEQGQAVSFERKTEIASRAYKLLTANGFAPHNIIFDVNVLSIGTGIEEHNNYGVDFIRAVEWIKKNLPYTHTSGGISNLSFSFRGNNPVREAMHSVFLYHAIRAGLDMAIVNPAMLQVYDEIDPILLAAVEDVVLNRRPDATERLLDIAGAQKSTQKSAKEEEWRSRPLDDRLAYALVRAVKEYLAEDINEALKTYGSPVEIIEGPLMRGMERVGELFGEGKMFLPQVVKSARIMKEAVVLLQPAIEQLRQGAPSREKIVLATAKGDVHDIGKNIVSIVLSCNNIDVIDLGVMVENERIIEAVRTHNADIVGVSGLITPSLAEMEALAAMMQSEGLKVPLMVGGATTSGVHTAVKLAPKYDGCVVHGGDASCAAGIVKRLLRDREGALVQVRTEQAEVRRLYENSHREIVPFDEVMERVFPSSAYTSLPVSFSNAHARHVHSALKTSGALSTASLSKKPASGHSVLSPPSLSELVPLIDWTPFFHFWGFKGIYPDVLKNDEAAGTFGEAQKILEHIVENDEFEAGLVVEFFGSHCEGNDMVLDNGVRLPMLRRQQEPFLSLADWANGRIGLFALKVEDKQRCGECRDFDTLLRESLCARLTEALAEWMNARYPQAIRPAFGYPACPDHSLKKDVCDLLYARERIGVELTSSYAMVPSTSLCGMLIEHPEAHYFGITHIGEDQLGDYARRRNITVEEAKRLMSNLL